MQLVEEDAPAAVENRPAAQLAHEMDDDAPVDAEKSPAAQPMHVDDAAAATAVA